MLSRSSSSCRQIWPVGTAALRISGNAAEDLRRVCMHCNVWRRTRCYTNRLLYSKHGALGCGNRPRMKGMSLPMHMGPRQPHPPCPASVEHAIRVCRIHVLMAELALALQESQTLVVINGQVLFE